MSTLRKPVVLYFAVLVALLLGLTTATGQQSGDQATLEERLVFGLEARRPSELAFLDAVVATVERGELPRKLVDRFYFWARERSSRNGGQKKQRPIIYFQAGLRIQAERLGINIRK